ncbi:MAG: type II secretion system protein [Phycisphaeraceae bacterium]
MRSHSRRKSAGFSLIELVIVVVIIGIIGAIAIPRMSRGAAGAADSALRANLSVLRNAVDLYAAEHGNEYPDLATIEAQLTQYTDAQGNTIAPEDRAAGDTTHIFGPYLRSIPPLPVGEEQGSTGFTDTPGTEGAAWVYNSTTGVIRANCADAEVDDSGTAYNSY